VAKRKEAKARDTTGVGCCDAQCCDEHCSCRGASAFDRCRVEAVVGIDARGQMVLPKELRAKAGFEPNKKLALVSWFKEGKVCCVTIQRAEDLAEVVRRTYGPLLSAAGSTAPPP